VREIGGANLPTVALGNSDQARLQDTVMVIGYPGSEVMPPGTLLPGAAHSYGGLRVTSGPHSGRTFKLTPALFLCDDTCAYLEGEQNEWGNWGYNREAKRGRRQIEIGLLTDGEGEPLAVRVFEGNTADCTTVAEQIRVVKEQFGVNELLFVGDRGVAPLHC
jgi:hypothetical protein